jgi:hypothetical protein
MDGHLNRLVQREACGELRNNLSLHVLSERGAEGFFETVVSRLKPCSIQDSKLLSLVHSLGNRHGLLRLPWTSRTSGTR